MEKVADALIKQQDQAPYWQISEAGHAPSTTNEGLQEPRTSKKTRESIHTFVFRGFHLLDNLVYY